MFIPDPDFFPPPGSKIQRLKSPGSLGSATLEKKSGVFCFWEKTVVAKQMHEEACTVVVLSKTHFEQRRILKAGKRTLQQKKTKKLKKTE
jgi:hypothetical protein